MKQRRSETEADDHHQPAVEHVLTLMRAHLGESLSVEQLASEAHLSPFHFSRVFRRLTGSPPGEFLGALRLDAARHLLLTTSLSVTDVCYEVGYTSLGSFTTRFTSGVGLPPATLRRLACHFEPERLAALLPGRPPVAPIGAAVDGVLDGPALAGQVRCVGLFPRAIPQGLPVACTRVERGRRFSIAHVPDGSYFALAAALPWSDDPHMYLVPGPELMVAVAATPLHICGGVASRPLTLALRRPLPTDPPLVASLPLLLARWMAVSEERPFENRTIEEAADGERCYTSEAPLGEHDDA